MNDLWINKYLTLLYEGKITDALEYKTENINPILYRFERFEECRLNTLEDSKIFLSNPTTFNDVFDTKGIYYSEEFIKSFYKKIPNISISLEDLTLALEKVLNEYYDHCGITCFTEDINNFPMWWSYADNRRGFCIEYDFSDYKKSNGDFLHNLHPVIYTSEKFNFEKLLRPILEQILDDNFNNIPAQIIFHYLLGTIKHKSWSYEKEWRYIELLNKCQFDFPVKVKAIYLGDNFLPSNIPRMVEISNKLNCELYQMTAPNHTEKSYSFIPKKIK